MQNHINPSALKTSEIAARVKDHLDDLLSAGLIDPSTYRRKSNFSSILRAINHADRIIVRDEQHQGRVIIYIPEGSTTILIDHQFNYREQINTEIAEAGVDELQQAWLIDRNQHVSISEITSRYLYASKGYPVSESESDSRIRKVSPAEFNNRKNLLSRQRSAIFSSTYRDSDGGPTAFYSPDENRIVFSRKFESSGFVRFSARMAVNLISLNDISQADSEKINYDSAYRIVSPQGAAEALMYESLLYLIPIGNDQARANLLSLRNSERRQYNRSKPTDRNVVVPRSSYG